MLFCFTPLSALLRHRSAYVICFLFLRALHSPKSASNARHKIISSQCRFRCSPPPLSPTDSLPGSTPVKSQQQALPPPTPYTTQFDFAHRTRITALSNIIIIIIISSSASSSQWSCCANFKIKSVPPIATSRLHPLGRQGDDFGPPQHMNWLWARQVLLCCFGSHSFTFTHSAIGDNAHGCRDSCVRIMTTLQPLVPLNSVTHAKSGWQWQIQWSERRDAWTDIILRWRALEQTDRQIVLA